MYFLVRVYILSISFLALSWIFLPLAPPAAGVGIKDELSSFPVPGEGKNRLVFVEFEFEGDNEEKNSGGSKQLNPGGAYGGSGVGSGGSIDSNVGDGGLAQMKFAEDANRTHLEAAGREEDDEEDANESDADNEPDERNK